jgi:anti-sigma factor RsiW
MTCNQTQNLIHAYVDGELDLVRKLEIEHHMQECAACSQLREKQMALRRELSGDDLYYTAPATLQERLSQADASAPPRRRVLTRWSAAAAAVALVAVGSFALGRFGFDRGNLAGTEEDVSRQVVAAHVRSLQVEHLTDVPSSDRHTVKPWFDGKINFAPVVRDLTDQGFPLVGGRLDYLHEHRAAAIVYNRRKHVINLFLWPAEPSAESAPKSLECQGYHLVHWTQGGINFWAISDLEERELRDFAELVRGAKK